jgi:hypothetical protein
MLDKPGLPYSAARLTAEYSLLNLEPLARMLEAQGLTESIKSVASIHRQAWDRKADLGTAVHTLSEVWLRGREIHPTDTERPYLLGLARFVADFRPRPLALEAMVAFEDEVGLAYAGTLDMVAELEGRGRWLLDIKTGAHLYDEIALQLAAYGYASWMGRPGDTTRHPIPEVEHYGVIWLRPELEGGYSLIPYQVGPAEWRAFMAELEVWAWAKTKRPKRERLNP